MPLTPTLFAAVTFDPTINLGVLIELGTFVGVIVAGYYALKGQVDSIRELLVRDREDDRGRDVRIDRLEGVVNIQAQTMQRVIGNMESQQAWEGGERRLRPRRPQ